MYSPLDVFLDWYKSIPVSHREDIAAIVGMSLPGYESIEIGNPAEVLVDQFIDITEAYKAQKYKEIGVVIGLRGFIQFFFIDKRSDRSEWMETEAMLKEFSENKNSETFEKMSREVKFKAEQWIVTCKKWEQIVLSHLSDSKLRQLI